MTGRYRYKAFISYAHADKAWADWLHKSLERYYLPQPIRVDSGQDSLRPIFRDQEELSGASNLSDAFSAGVAGIRSAHRDLLTNLGAFFLGERGNTRVWAATS